MISILKLRLLRLKDELWIMAIMTAMAIGLTAIFALSVMSNPVTEILVVNNDDSSYSKMLLDDLKDNKSYKLSFVDYKSAVINVEEGWTSAALIIDEDFGQIIRNGDIPHVNIMKMKDTNEVYGFENLVTQKINEIILSNNVSKMTSQLIYANKSSVDKERIEKETFQMMEDGLNYKKPLFSTTSFFNVNNQDSYNNTKHMMIGFSLFFSMFTIVFGIGEILKERKYNTWQKLIITPISKASILGGNLLITFLMGISQVYILILVGKYLFGIDWGNSMLGIALIAAAFVFTVTCLGLMISGLVKTYAQLSSITPVILVSTSMLGGAMWPLEIVNSKVLLFLANITPQKWAIQGMEQIAMYGAGFKAAVIPLIVLMIMGIIFFTVGVKLVKFE